MTRSGKRRSILISRLPQRSQSARERALHKKKTTAPRLKNKVRQGKTYNRALRVLARMRRTGETLTAAAREERIDPRTVRKYLGSELRGFGGGEIYPTKGDRLQRKMLIITPQGMTPAVIKGSRSASRLGRYMAAVGKYLRTGDTSSLNEFGGQTIGGHRLITDADTLSSLAQAGALQLNEIYALRESSS